MTIEPDQLVQFALRLAFLSALCGFLGAFLYSLAVEALSRFADAFIQWEERRIRIRMARARAAAEQAGDSAPGALERACELMGDGRMAEH